MIQSTEVAFFHIPITLAMIPHYLDCTDNGSKRKGLSEKFPKSQTRLVVAWIEIRHEELNANGKLAVNGEEVFKIDPLK